MINFNISLVLLHFDTWGSRENLKHFIHQNYRSRSGKDKEPILDTQGNCIKYHLKQGDITNDTI